MDAVTKPVVLVTGGSGLLGRSLIDRLRSDHRVVSLDLKADPHSAADVEFVCVDVTSDESVARAIDRVGLVYGTRVASLVHLAAFYDFSGAPSPLYQKVTVEGTRRLLDASKALELGQFVFSSTMLVHRPAPPGRLVSEADPLEATWAYPESKIDTEELIRERRGDARSVILRLAGVYDHDGHSPPIVDQIKRIHGRAVTSRFYPADLARGQAFVHRDDAIDAMVRTVNRRDELPDDVAILIGEPTTMGYGDLQAAIGRALHGEPWRTFRIPVPVARVGAWLQEHNPLLPDPFIRSWMVERAADHYQLDISRARRLLGWEPRHGLAEVIPEMVRRLRADPKAWYAGNELEPPRRGAT